MNRDTLAMLNRLLEAGVRTDDAMAQYKYDDEVVVIPAGLLDDLMSMARQSQQYRAGFAWTAVAVSTANRIYNGFLYRRAHASSE